jgi:hypothetical protein
MFLRFIRVGTGLGCGIWNKVTFLFCFFVSSLRE